MTSLDMDQGLIGRKGARPSLEMIWKRYIAITKAISQVNDIEWESGKKPVDSEIIGVYGGKSAYYDQSKVLQHVRYYPDMVEWLERSELDTELEDKANTIWGFFKSPYVLKDLEKWLVRKQKESDRKGKKKETVKQKGKGKKSDGDVSSSPPPKRAHKKSVGRK
jgi:hypothetical protein